MAEKQEGRKRGNALGFWFFKTVLRATGLKSAYFFLNGVCLYYVLCDRQAVRSAMYYIEKRFPRARGLEKYIHVHRLFVNQGRQLVDRFAIAYRPDLFRFDESGNGEAMKILQDSGQGVVLLTSHAGNWQVALRQMGHLKKEICVVMRPEENEAVRESLQMGNSEAKPVTCINPEGHLGGVLEMIPALQGGKMVSIMGDRGYGFETVEVPFLGHTAYFPYGAFLVAAAARCPVIPFLTHKTSDTEYTVRLPRIWRPVYEKGADRREQLKRWVADYAKLLEDFVREHPYDCFLFYNVWDQNKGVLNDGR